MRLRPVNLVLQIARNVNIMKTGMIVSAHNASQAMPWTLTKCFALGIAIDQTSTGTHITNPARDAQQVQLLASLTTTFG